MATTDPTVEEVERLRSALNELNQNVADGSRVNPHDYAYEAFKSVEKIEDYLGGGVGWNERIRDVASILRDSAVELVQQRYARAGFVYGLAGLLERAYLGNELHTEVHALANQRRIEASRGGS